VATGLSRNPALLAAIHRFDACFRYGSCGGLPQAPPISNQQAMALLMNTDWSPVRPQLLEFIIHQSQVLDMIPQKWRAAWYPIVHDALLYFLDSSPRGSFSGKAGQSCQPPSGNQRGQYLSAFVSKFPAFRRLVRSLPGILIWLRTIAKPYNALKTVYRRPREMSWSNS